MSEAFECQKLSMFQGETVQTLENFLGSRVCSLYCIVSLFLFFCFSKCSLSVTVSASGREAVRADPMSVSSWNHPRWLWWVPPSLSLSLSDLNRSISYVPRMNIFSQSILSKVNSMKSSAFCSFSNMQFSILLIVAFNPLSMLYQSYSVLFICKIRVQKRYKSNYKRTLLRTLFLFS